MTSGDPEDPDDSRDTSDSRNPRDSRDASGSNSVLMRARALVLHDLERTGVADPATVSVLESALVDREWWVRQWAEGAGYVVGLVAQDVQDALLQTNGRWPLCRACDLLDPHALYVHPDLGGPEPSWVCEQAGITVAPVGHL